MTENWAEQGDCRGHDDPEQWFPIGAGDQAAINAAINVCRGCPVRTQCLDYAIHHGEPHGIWGGTTEYDRRTLRRNLAATAPPDAPRKECANCHETKALLAFGIRGRNADGLDSQCKDCRNAEYEAKQLTKANT